jgi:DNA-binding NarL/FixJ family response regulator
MSYRTGKKHLQERSSMPRPRVLLADDHTIVRDGLKTLLETDFDVVGAVGDGRTLVEEAERLRPDVIVADISMPLLNGIEATRQLIRNGVQAKIVVLTMHVDVTYATEVLEAGASAYVLKNAPADQLTKAIREVLRGNRYVSPEFEADVLPFMLNGAHQMNKRVSKLTPRQREVLQLLAEGHTNKEIAAVLNVSPRTVEFHKYRMMQDLGLHSTAELTRYALKHGVITQ